MKTLLKVNISFATCVKSVCNNTLSKNPWQRKVLYSGNPYIAFFTSTIIASFIVNYCLHSWC